MQKDPANRSILALRPNASLQDARTAFLRPSADTLLWRAMRGRPQRIAAAYVPFRIYRAQYRQGRSEIDRYFALDQVQGLLDLYEFSEPPQASQLVSVQTRNVVNPGLLEVHAESILREKVFRAIFQQGFFRGGQPHLRVERLPQEFYIAYWLAFYGTDGQLRCRVMDSVRRRMEGGKATALFEHWLAA